MKDFAERLQYLMDSKKTNQQAVAVGASVHRSRVSAWLNRKAKDPRRETLQKLSGFFGCNINWLATGEGPIFIKDSQRDMILNGNGNIQAGGAITGKASIENHAIPDSGKPFCKDLILDEDERELILKLRDVGGKRTLRKFINELDRIKKLLDDEI